MYIIYPYNENLPKCSAHDIYIFHNCRYLAQAGHKVSLMCGCNSIDDDSLYWHFNSDKVDTMQIYRLPIMRKKTIFRISWNLPFLFCTQRYIEKERPDIFITSVLKQGQYHFNRKIQGIKYVYEAHQLEWYPGLEITNYKNNIKTERNILQKADLITVTTTQLKEILQNYPYSLKNHIEVIPLGIQTLQLPPPKNKPSSDVKLMYIGQLYKEQGLHVLFKAIQYIPKVKMEIIGGNKLDICKLQKLANTYGIEQRVYFHGFCPPQKIYKLAHHADAFVAPFTNEGRMPYVAHTKLLEYAQMGRPMIIPDLPITHEHFPEGKGILFFKPNNSEDLANNIQSLINNKKKLQKEIGNYNHKFSWEKRTEKYIKVLCKI